MIRTAYKFRLYPNKEQETFLSKQFGVCRFVYNHFLRERINFYVSHKNAEGKKGLTFVDTSAMLTRLKREPGFEWMGEVTNHPLQQTLIDLDKAYNNFFNRRAQFPKFKSKRNRQSFRVAEPRRFHIINGWLTLPKMSPIRMVVHRQIEGKIKLATISRTPTNKFFASIVCEKEIPDPIPTIGMEIGIDLGLKSFLTTSEGEKIKHPKYLLKAEKRLTKLHRKLSRRNKGSSGREKAMRAVVLQYEKITNCRIDFLHKLSSRLVRENQTIHAENLNVKGMLSNHRLAKRISDSGWGEFLRQLGYKCAWRGKCLILADRFFPSSKRCHCCGWVNQDLRLSDREWRCKECGTIHDRDFNAAINILNFGKIGQELPELTPVEIPHEVAETGSQPQG